MKLGGNFVIDWDLLDITRSKIYELLQGLFCFACAEVKLSSSRCFMLRGRQIVRKYCGFGQQLTGRNKLHPRQRVQRPLPEPVRSQACFEEGLAFGILVLAMPAVVLPTPEIAYRTGKITVRVDAFSSELSLKRQSCVFFGHSLLNKVGRGGT